MSFGIACRCCLVRAPDKELKTEYSILGKKEIYADMLKDCFEIQVNKAHIQPLCIGNNDCIDVPTGLYIKCYHKSNKTA